MRLHFYWTLIATIALTSSAIAQTTAGTQINNNANAQQVTAMNDNTAIPPNQQLNNGAAIPPNQQVNNGAAMPSQNQQAATDTTVPPNQQANNGATVPLNQQANADTTVPPNQQAAIDTTVPPNQQAATGTTAPPNQQANADATVPPNQQAATDATNANDQQTAPAAASNTPALAPDYRYNPQPNGLDIYQLLQPPFEDGGDERCMTVAPKRNRDEQAGVLYEGKCGDAATLQYVNYWEVQPKSDIFMIRYTDPMTCLAVLPINNGASVVPTLATAPCERNPNQLFRLKAAPGGGNGTTPYQMIPYTLDACVTAQGQFNQPFILSACDPQYAGVQNWYFQNVHNILSGLTTSMTINQYAERFNMKNFTNRLGMARQQALTPLSSAEVRMINQTLPGALKPFNTVIDLAKMIRINVQNTWKFHQAGANLIDPLANAFFTPDQQKGFIGHPIKIIASIVGALPIPQSLTKGLMEKAAAYSKQRTPTATDILQWDLFALSQSDETADSMYTAYAELFNTASIDQLSSLLDEYKAGKYDFTAESFYRNYRVNIIQSMLAALGDTFWVGVCVGPNEKMCSGSWNDKNFKPGSTFNTYYVSNVPDTALNYLEEKMQERNNFFEGKNNWVLTRYMYTCPNNNCRARLILRGGRDGPKFERV